MIHFAGPMEKLHSLPKLVLDSEEAREVQHQYDHLLVEMDQYEKATVEVSCSYASLSVGMACVCVLGSPLTCFLQLAML